MRRYLDCARSTWWLVAVNVAVWTIICFGADPGVTRLDGMAAVALGAPWTLLTYSVTHVYASHLLVNCAVLAVAGCIVERMCGAWRTVLLYGLCALAGGVVYLLLCAVAGVSGMLTGASAAVMGLVAYAVCAPARVPRHVRITAALAAVVLLAIGLLGDNPGGACAHIGGVLAGIGAALVMRPGREKALCEADRARLELIERIERCGYTSLSAEERRRLLD